MWRCESILVLEPQIARAATFGQQYDLLAAISAKGDVGNGMAGPEAFDVSLIDEEIRQEKLALDIGGVKRSIRAIFTDQIALRRSSPALAHSCTPKP